MTKAELSDAINEIYDKVLEMKLKAKTLEQELAAIGVLLEQIPEDMSEIKEEEDGENANT
jgi:hypothetical protein